MTVGGPVGGLIPETSIELMTANNDRDREIATANHTRANANGRVLETEITRETTGYPTAPNLGIVAQDRDQCHPIVTPATGDVPDLPYHRLRHSAEDPNPEALSMLTVISLKCHHHRRHRGVEAGRRCTGYIGRLLERGPGTGIEGKDVREDRDHGSFCLRLMMMLMIMMRDTYINI